MTASPMLMAGKKGLVMGVANDRSIAWGITSALAEHGAEVGLTYQNGAFEKRVRPLGERLDCSLIIECDVNDHASIQSAMELITSEWGKLDFLVHAVAFSDKSQLTGRYLDTSLENFITTMSVSCYSLTSICRAAAPLMENGGRYSRLLTLAQKELFPIIM